MSEKKIQVPEGMLEAVCEARYGNAIGTIERFTIARNQIRRDLEAGLRWLSENPIVPTDDQVMSILERGLIPNAAIDWVGAERVWLVEWQRRMFLAPDEDEPIKDLLDKWAPCEKYAKADLREAYRRGKESK